MRCSTTTAIPDWLIHSPESFSAVSWTNVKFNDLDTFILSNGLISRQFVISPNFATIAFDSYLSSTKSAILRSLSPDAIIGINGIDYNIGGIQFINTSNTNSASPNTAYIDPQWLRFNNLITNKSNSFIFTNNITETPIWTPYEWKSGNRHSPKYLKWPPLGKAIQFEFMCNSQSTHLPFYICENLKIYIRYEMYQGIPLLSKSLLITSSNPSLTANVSITNLIVDVLKVNVPYSPGSNANAINQCVQNPNTDSNMMSYSGALYLESDQAHGTEIKWFDDFNKANIYGSYQPNVYIGYPSSDWTIRFAPNLPGTQNGMFRSFRALELVLDVNYDRLASMERTGLARRRMLKLLAPQTTENPIFAATIESEPFSSNESLHKFIDQCNETGFEMLIFSFGSGFNMETNNQSVIDYYADIIKYAKSKNIEIGGYDLIELDRTVEDGQYQQLDASGNKISNLCFASGWYDDVSADFSQFIDIGMSNIITDGPYGGGGCYSLNHSYHENVNDSVFRQQTLQNDFFVNLRNRDVYIHQPDNFFYSGGSKSGMGYNENQYSLPRWLDLSVSRMGMYDDTYFKLVTQGWMFLPLTAYHSDNPDCYFEPLSTNIKEYDWALGQYFGFGVMAMIRGKELYDTQQVRDVVIKWTSFYKKHREILIGDIIHLRRCDMQYFDAILHVDPLLDDEKGLAVFYNPTNVTVHTNYTFSLYYTGIKGNALVSCNDGAYQKYVLSDLYDVTLSLDLSPLSINYYLFR